MLQVFDLRKILITYYVKVLLTVLIVSGIPTQKLIFNWHLI